MERGAYVDGSTADDEAETEYSFDKRGNMVRVAVDGQVEREYVFDATNMMAGATVHGVGSVEYGYSGFRKRVRKLERFENGEGLPDPEREVRHVLDITMPYDDLLMARGGHSQSFVWGKSLVEARSEKPEDAFYYLHDHLGSPVRLLGADGGGEPLAYDEFGVPLAGQGASARSPFGFTSYQTEDITGLWFAQARYYEPTLGRFSAEDLLKVEHNNYVYCGSNSMRFVDRNGLCKEDVHRGTDDVKADDAYGTYKWALDIDYPEDIARKIADFNNATDSGKTGPMPWQTPSLHFNTSSGEKEQDSRLAHADKNLEVAIDLWNQGSEDEALRILGMGLHAIQDYEAHGNASFDILSFLFLFNGTRIYSHAAISNIDDMKYDWANSKRTRVERSSERQRLADIETATKEYLTLFADGTGINVDGDCPDS